MYQVVGIERKTGEYNGKQYDNTILYCGYPKDGVDGTAVEKFKIKTAHFTENVIVGDMIGVHYDRFGNVAAVYKE